MFVFEEAMKGIEIASTRDETVPIAVAMLKGERINFWR